MSMRERWYCFRLAYDSSPLELTVAEPVWSDPCSSLSRKLWAHRGGHVHKLQLRSSVVGARVRRANIEIFRYREVKDAGIQLRFGIIEST